MELHFVAPCCARATCISNSAGRDRLADDHLHPRYHVSMWTAMDGGSGAQPFLDPAHPDRRLSGQADGASHRRQLVWRNFDRAAIGPIRAGSVLLVGGSYCLSWGVIALLSARLDAGCACKRQDPLGMG